MTIRGPLAWILAIVLLLSLAINVLISGFVLTAVLWAPADVTFARTRVPCCRSTTNVSPTPFVSPDTRFVAALSKATIRPTASTVGQSLRPLACAPANHS